MISLLRLLKNSRRPDVTFCPDGHIDITSRVGKMLSLREGDVIDVAVTNGEYLLYVKHRREEIVGKHRGMVYATKKLRKTHNFRVGCSQLTTAIYDALDMDKTSPLRFPVGEVTEVEGLGKAVAIITRMRIED